MMKRALTLLLALALTVTCCACDLGDLTELLPKTEQNDPHTEQTAMPTDEETLRATVRTESELYRHIMTAMAEGYAGVILDLDLDTPLAADTLWHDHVIDYAGGRVTYYVLRGEDTDTYTDQTLMIRFLDVPEVTELQQVTESAEHVYPKWQNGATFLREQTVAASPHRRGEDFEDFPICRENGGEVRVNNSEQLWIALEKGFLPTFAAEDHGARRIFELAKSVLRQIITEDMSALQKLRAIYDWLCETIRYDYDALAYGGSQTFFASHYPEGVFDMGRAVCEGIAKAAVILCRIEGIPCVMVEGSGAQGGHAWNAVQYDGQWYTLCATFGMMKANEASDLGNVLGGRVAWTSYRTFLAPLSYMDATFPEQRRPACLPNDGRDAYVADALGYPDIPGATADGQIESSEELDTLFATLAAQGLTKDYYLVLTSKALTLTADMLAESARKSTPDAALVLHKHTEDNGQVFYTVFVH